MAKPLDARRLEELALAYVARFATTTAKLDAYLKRKLRERGWEGEGDPPLAAMAERFVAAGFIDDAAWAKARTGSLLRRGYGLRRIGQALGAAGIDADVRNDVTADQGDDAARGAALALARKRRFGPFGGAGSGRLDPAVRQKQMAAMLRAGHPLDSARELVDARSIAVAERWAQDSARDDADDFDDRDEDLPCD